LPSCAPVSTTPGGSFDVAGKQAELETLKEQAAAPDLWDNQDRALEVTRKLSRYETTVNRVHGLDARLDDAEIMLDLAAEEDDAGTRSEVIDELQGLDSEMAILERETLYFGEYDDRTAILSINAGAGGVDAQDWAEMMLRMYTRFLEKAGYTYVIDDISQGDEAGIKSATLTVKGDFAYANLESERGVHRLVRISPFDSASRRHTSFAGVDVVPEVETSEVEIDPEDLRIDTYRSQGAGGQHVNTSDSAVRITHLPTGIVVACQNERSQLQNKNRAMQILASRLAEHARQEQLKEIDAIRGEQNEAAWGRQIRSYVLQPYQMIKDLRTEAEVGNVSAVLDGDIDMFIEAYLQWRRAQTG
jgi:peptide chain release factor 2